MERRSSANVERHIQTIMIALVTGSIVFASNYFFTDKESKAILLTNLTNLTTQVAEVRADLRKLRDEQASKAQVMDIEMRLREVERAVDSRGLRQGVHK